MQFGYSAGEHFLSRRLRAHAQKCSTVLAYDNIENKIKSEPGLGMLVMNQFEVRIIARVNSKSKQNRS